jgi:hypothetical protein
MKTIKIANSYDEACEMWSTPSVNAALNNYYGDIDNDSVKYVVDENDLVHVVKDLSKN